MINKNIFLHALACPARGWLIAHPPASVHISPGATVRMEQGRIVGEMARQRYPSGILVASRHMAEAAEQTASLMKDETTTTLFEGAFLWGDFAARADLLHRTHDGWILEEVKSSTRVKPEYIADAAYTAMVLQGAGVVVADARLSVVDKTYRKGDGVDTLFVTETATTAVLENASHFAEDAPKVSAMVGHAEAPAPTMIYDCRGCDFFERHCLGRESEQSIFLIPRLGEAKFKALRASDVAEVGNVPADFKLSKTQRRVVDVLQSQVLWTSDNLSVALEEIEYPAFYLDFETVSMCLPLFDDTAPFEQVPTQYSLHIRRVPGEGTTHREFLATAETDERRILAERLLDDLESVGHIIVYSSFEKSVLNALGQRFPDLKPRTDACLERLFDLEKVIKEHVCHPAFMGQTSIKKTLPALVPDLNYGDLTINNGDQASAMFYRMAVGEVSGVEADRVRQDLLTYCKLDTMAMVRLHDALATLA